MAVTTFRTDDAFAVKINGGSNPLPLALLAGSAGVPIVPSPPGPIAAPSQFAGTVPFSLTRGADGSISHNYDIVAAKPAYTGTIYVGAGGVDTADGLTYPNRVRSLKQGIVRANARAAATRLLVDPGVYKYSDVVSSIQASFAAQRATVDIVIEPSSAGKIVSLSDVTMPTFVATADAQVYVSTYTTESVGQAVIDRSVNNAKGRPKALRRAWPSATDAVTVAAALQARHTAYGQGAFYLDTANKKLYVRLIDGRAPDANLSVMSGQNFNFEHYSPSSAIKLWMDSVEIWGGNNPFRVTSGATGTPPVWHRSSGFCYAGTGHGLSWASGGGTIFGVGSAADDNAQDGLNYNGIASGASPAFYEFNVTADSSGWGTDGENSCNGSTSHVVCRGVRVNCSYTDCSNRAIHDIQDAQTWNLGCTVGPNRAVTGASTNGATYASVASGYPTLVNTSKVWVDACSLSAANPADYYAYDGGQVYYANMRTPRVTTDISGAGSAVSPYQA